MLPVMTRGRSGPLASLRRTLDPALWSPRAYWGTAVLLAATAAVGLAALLPVTSLVAPVGGALSPRFALPPWQGGDLGMNWSTLARSPTVTQRAALGMLFRLLVGVAAGVVAVAGLTVMSLSAARASARPFVSVPARGGDAGRGALARVAGGARDAGGVGGGLGRVRRPRTQKGSSQATANTPLHLGHCSSVGCPGSGRRWLQLGHTA